MIFQGGGASNISGAQITDGTVGLADMTTTGKPTYYINMQGTVVPILPLSNFVDGTEGASVVALATNTQLRLAQMIVTGPITVAKVSLDVNSVNTTGTFKIACYSEDGQTKLWEEQSGSVSAGGIVTITLSSPVYLAAGKYYFAFLTVGTASLNMLIWRNQASNQNGLFTTGVTGKAVTVGSAVATASTIPSTISPTALTAQTSFPMVRLDA